MGSAKDDASHTKPDLPAHAVRLGSEAQNRSNNEEAAPNKAAPAENSDEIEVDPTPTDEVPVVGRGAPGTGPGGAARPGVSG